MRLHTFVEPARDAQMKHNKTHADRRSEAAQRPRNHRNNAAQVAVVAALPTGPAPDPRAAELRLAARCARGTSHHNGEENSVHSSSSDDQNRGGERAGILHFRLLNRCAPRLRGQRHLKRSRQQLNVVEPNYAVKSGKRCQRDVPRRARVWAQIADAGTMRRGGADLQACA